MSKSKHTFDFVMLLIALVCGAMLMWLSILRYEGYNARMLDLGVMAQSMWTAAEKGLPLISTAPEYGARSRMHVHVEWIYYLFVPFYKLWSDPRLLLVGQTLFFILGTIPVYRLALRHTQSIFAARCLSVIYLFYPVAQTSVLFDFHGDTLAMPILLFMLDALDRCQWWQYGLFGILALSCKMYVAAPVAILGVCLVVWSKEMVIPTPHLIQHNPLRKDIDMQAIRRVGAITLMVAMTYGAIAFLVIRPLFAPETSNFSETTGSYLSYYFGNIEKLWDSAVVRLVNAIIVVAPVVPLAWRAWQWLLPGLLLTGVVITSTGPDVYDIKYHHYALVVPFLVMATIVGMARIKATQEMQPASASQETTQNTAKKRKQRLPRHFTLLIVLEMVIILNMAFVDTPLNPRFWMGVPRWGLDHTRYGITPRDSVKDVFLATSVPPDVPIAASTLLAPHLANRTTLYLTRYPQETDGDTPFLQSFLPQVDYIVMDSLFDFYGLADYDHAALSIALQHPKFDLVAARDGLLLFQRDANAQEILHQQVESTELPDAIPADPIAHFGETIDLVKVTVQPLGNRRFRAQFTWVVPDAARVQEAYIAVSRLDGTKTARMVHIPTYALLPITAWQSGQVVTETFDVEIPSDIPSGRYDWKVGWYSVQGEYSFATDERSAMPGSTEMVVTTIEVP